MIGQTLTARRPFPLFALFFMLVALANVVVALGGDELRFLLFALPTALIALQLYRTRPGPFHATLTETAIVATEPAVTVPYDSIQGLLAGSRHADPYRRGSRRFSIQIRNDTCVLEIPPCPNVPSDEVYRFIFRQVPTRGAEPVHPSLSGYLRDKQHTFGSQRVWQFGPRQRVCGVRIGHRQRAAAIALFLSSVVYVVFGIGAGRGNEGWLGGGVGMAVAAGILWLIGWERARRFNLIQKDGKASVVISPDGLALLQGELRGEMCWNELLDVKLGGGGATFSFSSEENIVGILLKVAGANIVMFDAFDRPLTIIFQQICYYWRSKEKQLGEPDVPPRKVDSDGIMRGEE